jgi:hypothetical protein
MARLMITIRIASVLRAVLMPISTTARPMACMMVFPYFSGILPLNNKPMRLPRIMLNVLTMVPSNFGVPSAKNVKKNHIVEILPGGKK